MKTSNKRKHDDTNNNQLNEFKNTQKNAYKTIKIPLKSILKNPDIMQPKIQHLVFQVNDLMIHTYQFIRLYVLHQYTNHPEQEIDYYLNEKFIICCMRTLVLKGSGGREGNDLDLMETLDKFYTNEYRPTTNHIKTSAIGN
jgi:hypothetical protein